MSENSPDCHSFDTDNTSVSSCQKYLPLGANRSFSYSSLTNFFNSSNSIYLTSSSRIKRVSIQRENSTGCPNQKQKDLDDLHSYIDDSTSESASADAISTDISNSSWQSTSQPYTVTQNKENDYSARNISTVNKRKSIFLETDDFSVTSSEPRKFNNISSKERRKRLLFSTKLEDEHSPETRKRSHIISFFSAKPKSNINDIKSNPAVFLRNDTLEYYKMTPMSPKNSNNESSCFSEKEMEAAFSKLEYVAQNYPFFHQIIRAVLKVTLKFVSTIQKYTTRFIGSVAVDFYFASCTIVKKYHGEKLDRILLCKERFHWMQDYICGINEFQIYLALRCGDIPYIHYYYQFLDRIKDILYILYPCIRLKRQGNEIEINKAMLKQLLGYPNPIKRRTEKQAFDANKTIKDSMETVRFKFLRKVAKKSLMSQ